MAIGIVSVLLGILVPVILAVRDAHESAECLNQLRSNGQLITMYAGDRRGQFPNDFSSPTTKVGSIRWNHSHGYSYYPAAQMYAWAYLLRDYVPGAGRDWENWSESTDGSVSNQKLDNYVYALACPTCQDAYSEQQRAHAPAPYFDPFRATYQSYLYSPALFTSHHAWNADTEPILASYANDVQTSSVAYPSNKAVLAETYSRHGQGPLVRLPGSGGLHASFHTLAADGHAAPQRSSDDRLYMSHRSIGVNHWDEGVAIPLLNTVGGSLGRDW